jgi:hypothetical protein
VYDTLSLSFFLEKITVYTCTVVNTHLREEEEEEEEEG